jgi:hypothetical protein
MEKEYSHLPFVPSDRLVRMLLKKIYVEIIINFPNFLYLKLFNHFHPFGSPEFPTFSKIKQKISYQATQIFNYFIFEATTGLKRKIYLTDENIIKYDIWREIIWCFELDKKKDSQIFTLLLEELENYAKQGVDFPWGKLEFEKGVIVINILNIIENQYPDFDKIFKKEEDLVVLS